MTLREQLQIRLQKDYSKAPTKIWNQNNLEMAWNENENLYIGIDDNGKEWVEAIQHTTVPIFSVKCTNKQRKDNVEVDCGAINFFPICNNEQVKCRKCDNEFTVVLNVPKSSKAYDVLESLDK